MVENKKMKGILFSTPMVQATEQDRKTQTRRTSGLEQVNTDPDLWKFLKWSSGYAIFEDRGFTVGCKPKYQYQDILYVRETWALLDAKTGMPGYAYKAEKHPSLEMLEIKWKPSLFMPKEAARIFLQITAVRAERLQDITEEDAMHEGISYNKVYGYYQIVGSSQFSFTAKEEYQRLWDSINAKKHPWDSNPWVWVYTYKKIEKL